MGESLNLTSLVVAVVVVVVCVCVWGGGGGGGSFPGPVPPSVDKSLASCIFAYQLYKYTLYHLLGHSHLTILAASFLP